jgi:DNA-binding Xre family transcriptional regulator
MQETQEFLILCMEDLGMPTYQKIKSYIIDHGMIQKSIAREANIPYVAFNAMLNGKRKIYVDELVAICCVLNVSPEFFITWKS